MAGGQKKKPPYATESELFARPAYKWLTREEIDRGYHPAKAASIAREREKRIKELNQNNLGNVKKFNDVNARQKTLGNKKQFNDLNAQKKTQRNTVDILKEDKKPVRKSVMKRVTLDTGNAYGNKMAREADERWNKNEARRVLEDAFKKNKKSPIKR